MLNQMEIGGGVRLQTLADFLETAGPVFDLLPDSVRICDMDGHVHFANRAFFQMSGYSPTELMSRPIDDIYVEEDRIRVLQAFQTVKKTGTSGTGTMEVRLTRKGGHPIMVSLKAVLIRNADGEPIGALALYRDVSKVERLMAEPLELLNLSGSPIEILRQLPARVSTYFPGRPWVMINLVEGDYLRFAYAANVPAELIAQGGEPLKGSICGIPISTGAMLGITDMAEDARTRKDAVVTQYGCRGYLGYPIFHSDGKVLGTICIVRQSRGGFGEYDHRILQMFAKRAAIEIERMDLETRVQEADRELRGLIHHAPVSIWRISPDGRFQMISKKGKQDLGYQDPETVKDSFFDLVHPDDLAGIQSKIKSVTDAKNADNGMITLQVRLRKRNGDYGNFFTTVRPIYDFSDRLKLIEGVAFEIPGVDPT